MTKKEIVIKVAGQTGLKQVDVKRTIQGALNAIVEGLTHGETVELRNFGVFKVKMRRGRIGRNPRTGTTVPVPPRKVVVFKPGLVMKLKTRQ